MQCTACNNLDNQPKNNTYLTFNGGGKPGKDKSLAVTDEQLTGDQQTGFSTLPRNIFWRNIQLRNIFPSNILPKLILLRNIYKPMSN